MGSSDKRFPDDGEGPVRNVSVTMFAIVCHAVSNLQFADFVRQTGYSTEAERYGWSFVFEGLLPDDARRTPRRAAETPWWVAVPHAYWAQPEGPHSAVLDRMDHPVVHISWNDAKAYCEWSATRLPTEAEWELAARGGLAQATFPWGNELTPGGEHRCNIWQGKFPDLNTGEDGYPGTAPVHALPAEWIWAAQYRRQCLGMVRGHVLAALPPSNRGRKPAPRFTGAEPLAARRLIPLSRFLLQRLSRGGAQFEYTRQFGEQYWISRRECPGMPR